MIDSNPVHEVCDYGAQALYRELPTIEQIRAGVVPLDSLPAAWWNALWNDTNKAVNEARNAIGVMVNELCNVLVGAGICPSCSCLDQLYQSINKIRQTLATASAPGSVVSSDVCGEVSVNSTTGIMTANGLGNAANLTTSARTAIGAINELKQTYDCCISTINTCTSTLNTGKAPVAHASSATTYGVGSATDYGHVRLSDTFASRVGGVAEGVAASQKALYDMYTCITSAGYVTLGNTAGCALGTASAGSASTAARSDHVHPLPSCVADKYGSVPIGIGYACPGLTCAQITNLAAYSTSYTSGCTVIKDVNKATVQCWLGLGTAAYCAAGCFRASTWTPSVVDCSKQLAAHDNSAVYLVAEGGNEINIKTGNSNVWAWLNYRGGICGIKVGLGTGDGKIGDVQARCFCGNVSGTATQSDKISFGTMTANSDRYVMIGDTGAVLGCYHYIGGSAVCPFTFNPVTGVLKANCFCGTATTAGSVSRATFGDCSNGEHNANNIKSNGLWYYTSCGPAATLGASTTDGALYSQAYNSNWVVQIAQDYRNGNLFVRGLNNGTWSGWQAIVAKCMLGGAAYCDATAFAAAYNNNTSCVCRAYVADSAVDATYACSAKCAVNSTCFNGNTWSCAVAAIRNYTPTWATGADSAIKACCLRWHAPVLGTDFKVCNNCLYSLKDFMYTYGCNGIEVCFTKKSYCFASSSCCNRLLSGVIFDTY